MVEKNVIVQYKLDWKKQLFGVLFTYEKLENTFSVLFEKNKMVQQGVEFAEEINTWLDNPKEYRVNVCKIGLNAHEKEELHTLFPYVPVFTTIKQFWNLYNEYQGLAHHKKDVQEIFGVPFEVLKACNDGEDDMLVYPNERQLLKKAFEENAAIFHAPLTTIASMWIHRYYSNLFYLYKNNCMELGVTIQYLNEQVEHQKDKNPYVIFVTYYNYLIYLNRCKTAYEMYPENLIMAEKMIAKEMVI